MNGDSERARSAARRPFSYTLICARLVRKRNQPLLPCHPSPRQRLIPILPPAILYRRYPGVIEGGFGEGAQVDGCQLAILALCECLGLAACHMRQQPISHPFPFGYGLVHQRLAAFVDGLAHYGATPEQPKSMPRRSTA